LGGGRARRDRAVGVPRPGAPDAELHDARSRLRPRLRAGLGPRDARPERALELAGFRRPQRLDLRRKRRRILKTPQSTPTGSSTVQSKFKELLHQYKLEVFHTEHDKRSAQEITTECLHLTEDVLRQKVHFHFHEIPDKSRAEIVNLIHDYVRE